MYPKFLHLDSHPIEQPENSYRYALNAMTQNGKFVNEYGNALCAELPTGYSIIGHTYATDSTILLLASANNSAIARLSNCQLTVLLEEPSLNFSLLHQMKKVIFRIRRGCEEVIYFTDDYNPPRTINLSKLEDYYDSGVFNPDKIKLIDDVTIPEISASVNDYGGSLRLGTYNFAIRYLDEDLNPTHWIDSTPTVAIYDESVFATYVGIDGGIDIQTDPTNGLPATSKSITLEIGNLDSSFVYYQIAVIAANSNTGEPSSYLVSPEIPISQSIYVVDGGTNGFTETTAEELAIPKQDIQQVRTMEIAENRLMLANYKGTKVDFAALQRAASQVFTTYEIEEVPSKDALIKGNPKNPNTLYEKMSEMGDEVKAYGVVYVFDNGYETPAFHIPGRPANVNPETCQLITGGNGFIPGPSIPTQWDTSPINEWSEDLRHVVNDPDDYTAGDLKRWQVYNTANRITPTTGVMGYHELENSTYPDIRDCNGNSIWGVDVCGNELTGKKIRHHRMPDRRLQKQYDYDDDVIRLIGVRFHNIAYPDPRIVGHYIVTAERTEENKTVLDKGVSFRYEGCSDLVAFSYMREIPNDNPFQFIATPRFLYQNEMLSGYLKVEGDMRIQTTNSATDIKELTGASQDDIYFGYREIRCTSVAVQQDQLNYAVRGNIKLGAVSKDTVEGVELANMSMTNNINAYHTYELLPQHAYTSIKTYKDVYSNLFNLKYYKIHAGMLDNQSSNLIFGGDAFISEFRLMDTKIRDIQESSWANVAGIAAIVGALVITAVTLGVAAPAAGVAIAVALTATAAAYVGITASAVSIHTKLIKDGIYEECLSDQDLDGAVQDQFGFLDSLDKKVILFTEEFRNLWVESEINVALRYASNQECGTYYQTGDVFNFIKDKTTYYNTEEKEFQVKPVLCPEIYLYNKDYSRYNRQKSFFSLPVAFDYCTECLEEFPNRITWSQTSLNEQQADALKIFLANDVQDFPGRYGEITNIIRKGEKVYVTTTDMLFYVPQNLQERINSDLVTYIGTGDFLAIPPREVVDSELGAVGCVDSTSTISTPYGTVILDSRDGVVYVLSDKLKAISLNGLDDFFRDNLRLQSTQTPNPAHPHGVGYITYYDAEEDRLIITKKDFTPKKLSSRSFLVYNEQTGYWFLNTGSTLEYVDVNDRRYFDNYSWTISYDMLSDKWISFHSYLPNYAFYNKRTFFTSNGDSVWIHNNKELFNSYYGNNYPHVLEVVDRVDETVKFQYIELHTEAIKDSVEQRFITFDQLWGYTNRQSTGLQSLRPLSVDFDYVSDYAKDEYGIIKIDKRERTWHIPELYDYVTDTDVPVATGAIVPYKEPNADAVDFSKDWSQLENFRDKYLSIRFILNLNNVQLLTNFVKVDKIKSE